MHRPLGRATLVVFAPFSLAWGLGLTASLGRTTESSALPRTFRPRSLGRFSRRLTRLRRALLNYARVRFGFPCLSNFAPTQNSPNTIRPQPRKNSLKNSFILYSGGEKFIKGVFAQLSPLPAARSYSGKSNRRLASRILVLRG